MNASVTAKSAVPFFFSPLPQAPPFVHSTFRLFRAPSRLSRKGLLAVYQFRKECSRFWKRNTHDGGDLGTTIPARRNLVRAAAKDFPSKISQKNAYSVYSEQTVFLPFCSFCYLEQNERNDIPFILKTE